MILGVGEKGAKINRKSEDGKPRGAFHCMGKGETGAAPSTAAGKAKGSTNNNPINPKKTTEGKGVWRIKSKDKTRKTFIVK